jgi:hypothetical protein
VYKSVIALFSCCVSDNEDNTEIADFAVLMMNVEPQSYHDAMGCEDASCWMEAMVKEMESQNNAGTYIEVPRPNNINILDN